MNSARRAPAKQGKREGLENGSRLTDWRRLLVRCGRKPTRKRVHALRVVTLRVLADLEYRLAENGFEEAGARVAVRWSKQASKLRHVLSSVRAEDVWISKLDALRKALSTTEAYVPRSNRDCLRQIDVFEDRLKQQRSGWEKKLVAEISDRRNRLEQLSQDIELAVEHCSSQPRSGSSDQIAEQFAAVADDFRSLDASNLHEFRKRIKKVRYLAEIFAATDPEAGRQAAVLRKMQSAIGEWHDWQELAAEARGNKNKRRELAELLETLAAESLEKALDLCQRSKERLLAEVEHAGESEPPVPKKPPVQSAVSAAASGNRRHA